MIDGTETPSKFANAQRDTTNLAIDCGDLNKFFKEKPGKRRQASRLKKAKN